MTADDLHRIRLAKASIGVLMTADEYEEFACELRRVLDKYLPLPDVATLADFADEPEPWHEREVR
jgi:hypothetical protein